MLFRIHITKAFYKNSRKTLTLSKVHLVLLNYKLCIILCILSVTFAAMNSQEYQMLSSHNQFTWYFITCKPCYYEIYISILCTVSPSLIYECLNSNIYTSYKNKLIRNSQHHSYNTRNNSNFRLPGSRLKNIRQSFFYKGIDLWNRLNTNLIIFKPNIQFKSNVLTFKKRIKTKLLADAMQ